VTPCDSDPCSLEPGQSYNATFTVESPEDTEDMFVKLVVQQKGDISLDFVTWVSCHFVDVPCAVKAGEVFRGNVNVPTHRTLSAVSG
ncbi:unnamed protein product, partial [Ixodes hexagonus]